MSLPHARGGVSVIAVWALPIYASSPRPWGCFCRRLKRFIRTRVFPTPVGVFPLARYDVDGRPSLPHARGGVSNGPSYQNLQVQSSPRPWGCFPSSDFKANGNQVFPTPVGVFP